MLSSDASLPFGVVHYFYLHTPHFSILSLVVWLDHLIGRGKKIPPQTGTFIEI